MLTLYDFTGSGNGYKVCLALAHLGLPYKLVECDILKGETRTPEFLAKNPNGRIPALQLDDGTYLAESDAILWYLAEGTTFAPADRLARTSCPRPGTRGSRPIRRGTFRRRAAAPESVRWDSWPEIPACASRPSGCRTRPACTE